jgi:hypothetical protein
MVARCLWWRVLVGPPPEISIWQQRLLVGGKWLSARRLLSDGAGRFLIMEALHSEVSSAGLVEVDAALSMLVDWDRSRSSRGGGSAVCAGRRWNTHHQARGSDSTNRKIPFPAHRASGRGVVVKVKTKDAATIGVSLPVESCCRLLTQPGCAMSLVACLRRPSTGDLDLVTAFVGRGKVAVGPGVVVSGRG